MTIKDRILKLSELDAEKASFPFDHISKQQRIIQQLAELLQDLHTIGGEEDDHWITYYIEKTMKKLEGQK